MRTKVKILQRSRLDAVFFSKTLTAN